MDLRHKDEIYDPRLANHVDKDKVNFPNDYVYKDLVSIIAIRDCCKKGGKCGFPFPKYIWRVGGISILTCGLRYIKDILSKRYYTVTILSVSHYHHSSILHPVH